MVAWEVDRSAGKPDQIDNGAAKAAPFFVCILFLRIGDELHA